MADGSGLPNGAITLEQGRALPQHKGRPMSDAEIRADIANDPDLAPEMSAADFATAIIVQPEGKVAISLRIDADVVSSYKATGRGWQTRMNDVLREGLRSGLEDPATQIRVLARSLERVASSIVQHRERRTEG